MDTRTRARLLSAVVGIVVFLLSCTAITVILTALAIILPRDLQGFANMVAGFGGLGAGIVAGGIAATLVYRAVLGRPATA